MNEIFKLDSDLLTQLSCSISPLCLFSVITVCATWYGQREQSVAERDCVSGEGWEGFMKKSLTNGAVKRQEEFSGEVGGTFQIDI